MRKSNWFVFILIVAAVVAAVVALFMMGLQDKKSGLNIAIIVVGVVVLLAMFIGISLAENRRKRFLRTSYISSDMIYNPEAGFIRLSDGASNTNTLEKVLGGLKYNFNVKYPSERQIESFKYIVQSDKFAQNGYVWSGTIINAFNMDQSVTFNNREELRSYIG